MLPNVITKTIELADGRKITIETGKLAKQADGSVVVRMGDTMLLATVVASQDAREGEHRWRPDHPLTERSRFQPDEKRIDIHVGRG